MIVEYSDNIKLLNTEHTERMKRLKTFHRVDMRALELNINE